MYIGRSATIGWVEVTVVDTPAIPGPTPSCGLKTSTVTRLRGLIVTVRTVTLLAPSTYRRVTRAGRVALGFCSVRYSLKPGKVVPSAKFHCSAGALAPKAT